MVGVKEFLRILFRMLQQWKSSVGWCVDGRGKNEKEKQRIKKREKMVGVREVLRILFKMLQQSKISVGWWVVKSFLGLLTAIINHNDWKSLQKLISAVTILTNSRNQDVSFSCRIWQIENLKAMWLQHNFIQFQRPCILYMANFFIILTPHIFQDNKVLNYCQSGSQQGWEILL